MNWGNYLGVKKVILLCMSHFIVPSKKLCHFDPLASGRKLMRHTGGPCR